jgi:hypothetical protein
MPIVWSRRSFASRCERIVRPEWLRAEITFGCDDVVDLLRVRTRKGYQRELQGRRNIPWQGRGRGVVWTHRISEFLPAEMANFGEEF